MASRRLTQTLRTILLIDLSRVRLVVLNTHKDGRGRLTAVEGESEIPFPIHRIFYVYDVVEGDERGGHAHPATEQLLIALSGSLNVDVMSPTSSRAFHLDDPGVGLYLPAMVWVRLHNFSAGAVCFAAASTHYAAGEVIRDWDLYLQHASMKGTEDTPIPLSLLPQDGEEVARRAPG